MSKTDPSKAKEAKAEFDLGMKACVDTAVSLCPLPGRRVHAFHPVVAHRSITTSTFKWKADFLSAEPHFKN